jgi:Reverse transcriptase (RNA-dependent DNA polymerase)
VPSLGKKRFVCIIVDDYSRYTWVIFLSHKSDTYANFVEYCSRVENEYSAPMTWYGRLSSFLIENGFTRGVNDTTLFTKKRDNDLLLVQIYVDDIIFGSTNVALVE